MAGTLVSYLPFTRSVTEDLSDKEWTVTGEPQIITLSQFPYKAAQFEPGQNITSNIKHGGSSTWMVEFWCFIPPITTSWESIIWAGSDDLFFNMLSIDSDGKLTIWSNTSETFSGSTAFIDKSDNTYFNRWIKIQFGWIYAIPVFGASAEIYDYNDQYIEYFNTASSINSPQVRSPISTSGIIKLAGNITMKIGQFRHYSSTNMSRYDYEFFPFIKTTLPADNIISNELLVHDTINFEFRNNISYTSRNKSQQWYYKNIGTADGLLVSGTSLTNVSPLQSRTSKAFYQTNRQKCFDTQVSKEIYMLFDVYFDGSKRWRAYEESSTNGITGITAQTSGKVNIFSNGTNVGASIPLTINKLETYLLHMRSDATNGYIEVFKDGELKYTYIGNVNNGDDFSNLELQSDGSGTIFSNIVISNQQVYDYDRWTGNYTNIQRTLTNETWVPEKCLKALLPQIQKMDLCGNEWTINGSPTIGFANSVNDNALQISGGAYLQTADKILIGGQDFSVSWWAYGNSSQVQYGGMWGIAPQTNANYNGIYFARYDRNSNLRFGFYNASGSIGLATVDTTFIGVRRHYLLIYQHDTKTVTVFVDGVQSAQVVLNEPFQRLERYILVGRTPYNASQYFNGTIDEFQIYDGVALHTENFTPPTTEDYISYKQQLLSDNTLKNHLVSWLSFDPSTDLCGNTWTVTGTPTIVTTNYLNGKATQFGKGYIYTNPPALRSNNFTIDFWEYIPSTVNGLTAQMVVIDGTDGTGTQCLDIGYDNGATVPSFWLGKGASSGWKYSNKIIGTKIRGQWVHRAVVRYNDKIYAFENGKLYTSFAIESNMYIDITGSSLFIGGFKRASRLHPGMLSEVRVYVGTALYTEEFTPPNQEDYFDIYWHFNKPAPILNTNYDIQRTLTNETWVPEKCLKSYLTTINNSINHLCGNTWTWNNNNASVVKTNTLNGKAISLSNNAYLEYNTGITLGGRSFTISGWFNMASNTGTWSRIFQLFTTASSETNTIRMARNSTSEQLAFKFYNASLNPYVYNISYNTWYHFAFVYDHSNSKVYIYINGKQIVSGNQTIPSTTFTLYLGKSNYNDGLFVGQIAEFMIHDNLVLYTEEFTPPNQEDYFETYWYFNKPAPILNTNYDTLRYLTNDSQTWKYINPGYNDIDHFTYTNSSVTQVQPIIAYTDMQLSGGIDLNIDVYQDIWIKFDFRIGNIDETGTIFSFPYGKGTLSILITKESTSSYYLATITHERNETNPIGQQLDQESNYTNYKLGEIDDVVSFIVHIKSDVTDKGVIEVINSYWADTESQHVKIDPIDNNFELINANINEGNNLSKTFNAQALYNIIVSNKELTFDDNITHNINSIQRSINNNEEYRIAKYCLKSWMMFDESPTKDLCGNTWTAYNNPTIIDTDVLHGKALQLNSGQYLYLPNTIAIGGNRDLTICGWYNMSTSSGTWASLFTFWQNTNKGPIIKLSKNANYDELAWDFSQGTYTFLGNANIDNKLHHFAYVYQAETKTISIYIDGKTYIDAKKMSLSMSTEVKRYNYKIYLGKSNYTADKAYVGTINEFIVYDGIALYTEEFTPPVHQITDDKLYYDQSTETMKFEYFADVQKTTWILSTLTTKKVIVSYLPFDDSIEDVCGNSTENTLDRDLVFNSTYATKNKSLQIAGTTMNNINITLPLKGKSFVSQFYLYCTPYDHYPDGWTHIYGLNQKNHSLNSIDIIGMPYIYFSSYATKDQWFSQSSVRLLDHDHGEVQKFLVTSIYDKDTSTVTNIMTKILSSLPPSSYIVNDHMTADSSPYIFDVGHNAGIDQDSSDIYTDEFKVYIDYTDDMSETTIDKNIEIRFNNDEESVYFEFYATTTAKSAYLNISIPLLSWVYQPDYCAEDPQLKLKLLGDKTFNNHLKSYWLIRGFEYGSNITASGLTAFSSHKSPCVSMFSFETPDLEEEVVTFVIWFACKRQDDQADLNIIQQYSDNMNTIATVEFNSNSIQLLNEINTIVFEFPITSTLINHLAVVVTHTSTTLYINGKWQYCHSYQTETSNIATRLTFSDINHLLEIFGFGFYNTNIFAHPINIGSVVGVPPSYKIPVITAKPKTSSLAIYHNNQTYYNKLVLPTDEKASNIRIYHNNTVYALSK